jgi:hypothetical protein
VGELLTPVSIRLRRFLAYFWAVMRHIVALAIGFAGWGLLSLPNLIMPLLPPDYAATIDVGLAWIGHPAIYSFLAKLCLGVGLLAASFLAWNEEREALEQKVLEIRSFKSADLPTLTFILPGMGIVPSGDGAVDVRVDLLILNSGVQTALHSWAATALLKSDRRITEEPWAYYSKPRQDSTGRPNLLFDDELIVTGGKRQGWIKFKLSEDRPISERH